MPFSPDSAAQPTVSAAPATVDVVAGEPGPVVALLLSAHSPEALREDARLWADRLAQPDARLEDAAFATAVRRDHARHRFALTAASAAEAISTLEGFARSGTAPPGALGVCPRSPTKIAFVFSGQGSHWAGMGRNLLDVQAFRTGIEDCDAIAKELAGISVIDELLRPEAESRLNNSGIGAIAVFSVQVALASLWKAIGITPDVVVGKSLGEVAAAYVAGALTFEDAALVAVRRSELLQRLAGTGRAALIGLPSEKVAEMLRARGSGLWIAGTMGPRSTVVAGEPRAVTEIVAAAGRRGVFARLSRIDIAFHTPHMDPLVPDLVAAVRSIRPRACTVPLVAGLRGGRVDGEALDASFWGDHLRQPFFLSEALSAAVGDGANLFVEISPHTVTRAAIAESLATMSCDAPVLASMRRDRDERRQFLDTAGNLFAAGCDVSLEPFFDRESGKGT